MNPEPPRPGDYIGLVLPPRQDTVAFFRVTATQDERVYYDKVPEVQPDTSVEGVVGTQGFDRINYGEPLFYTDKAERIYFVRVDWQPADADLRLYLRYPKGSGFQTVLDVASPPAPGSNYGILPRGSLLVLPAYMDFALAIYNRSPHAVKPVLVFDTVLARVRPVSDDDTIAHLLAMREEPLPKLYVLGGIYVFTLPDSLLQQWRKMGVRIVPL